MRFFVFERKNPVEWTRSSSSSGLAAARSAGVGIAREHRGRDLVDHLVGALRGEDRRDQQLERVSWCSAQSSVAVPGYSPASRSTTVCARVRRRAASEPSSPGRPRTPTLPSRLPWSERSGGSLPRAGAPKCEPAIAREEPEIAGPRDRRTARRAPRVRRRRVARPRGLPGAVARSRRGRGTRHRRLPARDGAARRRPRARLRARRAPRPSRRRRRRSGCSTPRSQYARGADADAVTPLDLRRRRRQRRARVRRRARRRARALADAGAAPPRRRREVARRASPCARSSPARTTTRGSRSTTRRSWPTPTKAGGHRRSSPVGSPSPGSIPRASSSPMTPAAIAGFCWTKVHPPEPPHEPQRARRDLRDRRRPGAPGSRSRARARARRARPPARPCAASTSGCCSSTPPTHPRSRCTARSAS